MSDAELDRAMILPEMGEIWQQTLNWQPSFEQQAQFQRLYQLILEGNRQFNLTRITEPTEFWEKHLWDSLSGIQPWLAKSQAPETEEFTHSSATPPYPPSPSFHVIDIGTGAGFPGVPVAIVHPDWRVVLLDSTRKKMAFLDGVLTTLGLENASTLSDRAEQVGHHPAHRGHYDLVLIRAVAAAAVCAEYGLPLLKLGGIAVLYRGQWTEAEIPPLEHALSQLGGKLERIEALKTPLTQSDRHCLYIRKTEPTRPTYPRPVGVPTQKPL